jgi:Tfp pilus assembly protein PilV
MARKATERRHERGLTLIEVLVAFFILFVVTLAVLQLLSMAYLVNLGSMVRTDLTYRAERVVETIRLEGDRVNRLHQDPTPNGCCPIAAGSTMTISWTDLSAPCQAFWGPDGANVVETGARYQLSYTITNSTVTVEAIPQTSGPGPVYLGPVANKAVVYVAQLQ